MKYPEYDNYKLTNQLHLPRPQPSDFAYDYFNGLKNGFYVDIGAAEGILCNNTVTFDKGYNWKGICIEPNSISFNKLKENRPDAECLNIAIADTEDDLEYWEIIGEASCLSGLKELMSAEHQEIIIKEVKRYKDTLNKIKIKCTTFSSLKKLIPNNNINYLSIDAEGADFNIIKSINYKEYNIDLISVEADHSFDAIKLHLYNNGYKHIGTCCGDKFFSKNNN
jgi:FkbM family methyltransferase